MLRSLAWTIVFLSAAAPVRGQDSTAISPDPPTRRRASWLADQRDFRAGDIITIVVDERMAANERTTKNAISNRSQANDFSLRDRGLDLSPSLLGLQTGVDNRSRDDGEANRRGDLTAVLSVRVLGFEPSGAMRIRGVRNVTVDGREQLVTLEGVVRSEDVSAGNLVFSSRVADATITYDGKSIGPRKGILGSILSIFWP